MIDTDASGIGLMKIHLSLLLPLMIAVAAGCGSEVPDSVPEPNSDESLQKPQDRSLSDDATTGEENFFHGEARAEVIRNIMPNELNVGGQRFRVKRNPTSLGGAFVYDPNVEYAGVQRYLVWWVPHEYQPTLNAYPLNGPSKMVTPGLEFPAKSGVLNYPNPADAVAHVFQGQPMEYTPEPIPDTSEGSYTVREYRMYRALVDTPVTLSEDEAIRGIAASNSVTEAEVKRVINNVQTTLMRNGWFGDPAQEIRRASDWNGETR